MQCTPVHSKPASPSLTLQQVHHMCGSHIAHMSNCTPVHPCAMHTCLTLTHHAVNERQLLVCDGWNLIVWAAERVLVIGGGGAGSTDGGLEVGVVEILL